MVSTDLVWDAKTSTSGKQQKKGVTTPPPRNQQMSTNQNSDVYKEWKKSSLINDYWSGKTIQKEKELREVVGDNLDEDGVEMLNE